MSRATRVGLGVALAAGVAFASAGAVSAHVTVSSPDASPGGFGKLVFRVPSESDTANTTALPSSSRKRHRSRSSASASFPAGRPR